MSEVFSPFVFPKYDKNTIDVDFGSEGILPTHLDRDYLESDDPGMKRRILEEIKILTSKMKLQSTHFYLNPQIDDELVYTYLRYCPEELAILNKWIRFPNKNFVSKLYTVADKLAKYTSFDKEKTTLYRGFWHSDNKSRANQKYAQQRLGLAEVPTEGSVPKKSGSQFRYVLTGPISFTRSSHIANKFGTIVISTSMKNMPHKFIDDNDSLIAAVFINNGFFRIPKLYDHIRFLKEVIVLPMDMKTEVTFKIKQTPVPLYYTPFNEETFKKNQQVEDEKFSLKNSLYTGILKVMGLDNYNTVNTETYASDFGFESIESASEGFISNLFNVVKPVDTRLDNIVKLAKAYLDRIEELKANSADILMVCKTNSTNDIFPQKLVRASFKTLPVFIKFAQILERSESFSTDDAQKLLSYCKKYGNAIGFTKIGEKYSLVSKEINHKSTHGRVAELGYNSATIKTLCQFIIESNIVAVFNNLENVLHKFLSSKALEDDETADVFDNLFQAYVDLQSIFIHAVISLENVLKRTYNPLKEYMENKESSANESIITNNKEDIVMNTIKEDSFNDIAIARQHHYEFISTCNFDVATESVGSVITNALVYIADCIIKLLNNFKTTIFKFYKTLKRTELRYYVESNTLKLKQILSVPYTDMVDVEVDIPRGMVKPYKVTTNNLIEILTVLDMKNRSEGFLSKIMDLEQRVTSNSDLTQSKKLGQVEDISIIKKTYNEVTKCFNTNDRTLKKKFSKVFEDDNCFEDSLNLLLNSETFDYEVSTINNNLEKCSEHMLNIVDFVKKNKTDLVKSDILDLSNSAMTIAKLFDMYGSCILDKQKVEHNFVLVLNAIKRACL